MRVTAPDTRGVMCPPRTLPNSPSPRSMPAPSRAGRRCPWPPRRWPSVLVLAGGPLRAFTDALGRALAADPRWVAAASARAALVRGYIALLWLVGGARRRGGPARERRGHTRRRRRHAAAADRRRGRCRADAVGAAAHRHRVAGAPLARCSHSSSCSTRSSSARSPSLAGCSPSASAAPPRPVALTAGAALGADRRHRRSPSRRAERSRARAAAARAAGTLGGGVRDALALLRPATCGCSARRLVGVRRRRAVGDAARARHAARARGHRARLLRRPGRQHDPDPRRRERRHGRRAAGLRRRGRSRARVRARLSRRGDLAARPVRPRRARRPAPHRRRWGAEPSGAPSRRRPPVATRARHWAPARARAARHDCAPAVSRALRPPRGAARPPSRAPRRCSSPCRRGSCGSRTSRTSSPISRTRSAPGPTPSSASLAFLETGAFVGLVAPGETAIVLGGVVAARRRGRPRLDAAARGPRRSATSPASGSAGASAAGSWSPAARGSA